MAQNYHYFSPSKSRKSIATLNQQKTLQIKLKTIDIGSIRTKHELSFCEIGKEQQNSQILNVSSDNKNNFYRKTHPFKEIQKDKSENREIQNYMKIIESQRLPNLSNINRKITIIKKEQNYQQKLFNQRVPKSQSFIKMQKYICNISPLKKSQLQQSEPSEPIQSEIKDKQNFEPKIQFNESGLSLLSNGFQNLNKIIKIKEDIMRNTNELSESKFHHQFLFERFLIKMPFPTIPDKLKQKMSLNGKKNSKNSKTERCDGVEPKQYEAIGEKSSENQSSSLQEMLEKKSQVNDIHAFIRSEIQSDDDDLCQYVKQCNK